MVLPQRATAEQLFSVVPDVIANAAHQYQQVREIEKEQLAEMAQHNLLEEWSSEVRAVVLEARLRIQEARGARERFRRQVREFVLALRASHEPLPTVLRHTRSMLQLLEGAGALEPGDGWLEAEVLEWAIEEFESQ
jgi:hypothetical protein